MSRTQKCRLAVVSLLALLLLGVMSASAAGGTVRPSTATKTVTNKWLSGPHLRGTGFANPHLSPKLICEGRGHLIRPRCPNVYPTCSEVAILSYDPQEGGATYGLSAGLIQCNGYVYSLSVQACLQYSPYAGSEVWYTLSCTKWAVASYSTSDATSVPAGGVCFPGQEIRTKLSYLLYYSSSYHPSGDREGTPYECP